jgi:predicted phage terminase large subunit-like protein
LESVVNPPSLVIVGENKDYVIREILGGEFIVTGTRYAVDDYYGKVIENAEALGFETHVRNIYKNSVDSKDGYLWHEKYTESIVSRIKERTSPRRFSSQYLNAVYEKDISLFNTSAIDIIEDDAVFTNSGKVCVRLPGGRVEVLNTLIAIDPAFSTSKTSDDCSILVGGKLHDGRLIVLDACLDRLEAREVVKAVQGFARRYLTLRLFYEANGVGLLLPELFKHESANVDGKRMLCIGHYEQRTKESKIQGVLELPINAGQIMMTRRVRDNERLWKQIVNFPAVRHDDFLDGLVTLFEKAIPSREQYQQSTNAIDFDNYTLMIDRIANNVDVRQSHLTQFNSYYE